MTGKERVVSIPNPVAIPQARSATHPSVSDQSLRVVAMGRLVRQKGFDLLLQAFSEVTPRFPHTSLVIYGDGPEREALQAQADALGLDGRVSFPGQTDRAAQALGDAALFVLPSRYEGFPNVLIEAMSLGRAVIAFDCPSGPAEIIRHEIDGLLVPACDVEALAAAMTRLLSDSELRARIAARAAEVSDRYSLQRVIADWERVLEGTVRYAET